jgi:ABC-type nitrate/sulfonate/bicarbonate transport system substrate-binding protein
VRIGWQIPWATQGQLVQILKHGDIPAKNGLKPEFIGRTYGPMLNELALAGRLDVVLTGDQPGLLLISKQKGWRGIGRLMYNRTVTYVPKNSPLHSMRDLKGKTIALPVGAAAERVTLEALRRAGLDPKHDVRIVNLDVREQIALVKASSGKKTFGSFDAMAAFDPVPAVVETQGLARALDTGKVVSLVLMNEKFLKVHPGIGRQVMQSLFDAYDVYRKDAAQADEWFLSEAGLQSAGRSACTLAASLEPNLKATSRAEMRVAFAPSDFSALQKSADFLKEKLGVHIDIGKFIDNSQVEGVR